MSKSKKAHAHSSHPETIIRLNRAAGHLSKVVSMVKSNQECVDVLQQLSAVISALESCRITLLTDHVKTCIVPEIKPQSQHLAQELEIIIKRALK